ncbi:TfpX/TfpZ family type IV pilin accessory protein [Panacagrimonas perspica]|uniref:TfpX/TfpZ family type IV pilin accessory protein n=1 Tax=Panacagrimonas perspica TaxID=381431 RepID=UPI001061DF5A|nr:TfpX/TfpZ family type IV pilin accessory protein [Panacagrimonas perspica]
MKRWLPGVAGLRAGAIHLSLSVAVALTAMAVIFLVWYPGKLAQAQGVSFLVLIMIGVDVVIGPLLTTLLYKPGKWGMRFDLFVIALLQTVALLYGMKTIYGGRPAYVVFNVDRFDVVPVQDVSADSLARAKPAFKTSMLHPRWAAARMPEDPETRSDILFSSLSGGADLPQLPEYFVPLGDERDALLQKLHPIEELRKINELDDPAWKAVWAGFDRPETDLGYLPMRGNAQDGAVILDAHSGEILGIRMLTPNFKSPRKGDVGDKKPPEAAPSVEPSADDPASAPT